MGTLRLGGERISRKKRIASNKKGKMALGDGLTTESRLAKSPARYMVGLAGRLPKWPTGADCKSAGLRLRWFESITYHHPEIPRRAAVLLHAINGSPYGFACGWGEVVDKTASGLGVIPVLMCCN
jgi:hypothetical protein